MRKKILSSEMTNVTLNKCKNICNSCIIDILFVTFLISISISSDFICFHWYLKREYIETTIY